VGALIALIIAINQVITTLLHALFVFIRWLLNLPERSLRKLAEWLMRFAEWLGGGRVPSPFTRLLGRLITLLMLLALAAFICRICSIARIYPQFLDLIESRQEPSPPIEATSTQPANSQTATPSDSQLPSMQAPLSGFDNALDLDGVDDYVSLPSLNLNSNMVTIEVWIKPNGFQNDWAGIVSSHAENTTAGLLILSDNEVRYIWNGDHYDWSSEAYAPPDDWSHVALVLEPTKATIYLNGVAHTNNANHLPEEFDGEMRIGHDAGFVSRYFNGAFDDIRIWNIARTQKQITRDMQMQLVGSELGLIAYYRLDEGIPGSNNSDVKTAHDVTDKHNGALMNFALEGSRSNWIASYASE
jgi:hypothetical protein